MEALAGVTGFVDAVGVAAGFSRHDSLRLTLVIEELFTNTVTHGHGGESEAPIEIAFDVEPGRVAVTYEDTGPPFDPFAAGGPAAEPATDEVAPGGFGLILVARLASDVGYVRAPGRNRIRLVVHATR
jgi:serine/threonine-protein kinase RsbW